MAKRSSPPQQAPGLFARLKASFGSLSLDRSRLTLDSRNTTRGDSSQELASKRSKFGNTAGPSTSHPSTRPAVHGADDAYTKQQVARMCAELKRVLDAHPTNRAALTYLATLERHLNQSGGAVFQRLPTKLLVKAHEQLMLVSSRHTAIMRGDLILALTQALATSKKEVAPKGQASKAPQAASRALHGDLRDAIDSDVMHVQEGRLSEFFELDRKS